MTYKIRTGAILSRIVFRPETEKDKAALFELQTDIVNNGEASCNVGELGLNVFVSKQMRSGCVYDNLSGLLGDNFSQLGLG